MSRQEPALSSFKHVTAIICVLSAMNCPCSGAWSGFHGMEREGRCDAEMIPSSWSPTSNVAWKTAIPGRGHSSPIVSGNAVYLTSTFEGRQWSETHVIWDYAVFALALLFALVGLCLCTQSIEGKQRAMEAFWQHIRLFLFALFLGSVVIVALFGQHLLGFDESALRSWLASIMLVLSCLSCCALFAPVKSRYCLFVGTLSIAFAIPVFVVLKYRGFICSFDSLKGSITTLALVSPLMLGCTLLAISFLKRKRGRFTSQDLDKTRSSPTMWKYLITGSVGLISSGMPFFLLLYRAGGYQMPDSYIWHERVKPDVSWWGILLLAALALFSFALGNKGRLWRKAAPRYLGHLLLSATALALGITFFMCTNFVETPRRFVRAVLCLDRETGAKMWTCEGLVGETRGRSRTITQASTTPVTNGKRIFGYFGMDGLMCVNPEGKLLWKKEESMFHSKFAAGTSPVVKDDILIVVSDVKETEELLASITALDCATGKVLWKKQRESHQRYAAYSTPLIKLLHDKPVVIVHGWYDIKGYDLRTGQERWAYPLLHDGKHLVASLASDAHRLYVMGTKQVSALDLTKLGTNGDPLLWSTPIAGEKSSTPVVMEGLLFLVTEAGKAICLDACTGDIIWEQRLKGRYYSSVVATGTQVFFTNESGMSTVVANDREFRQLSENQLDGSIYASIAPAESQLFMRTHRHLYCIAEDGEI